MQISLSVSGVDPPICRSNRLLGYPNYLATGILGMITDGYIRQQILDAYAEVIIEDAI